MNDTVLERLQSKLNMIGGKVVAHNSFGIIAYTPIGYKLYIEGSDGHISNKVANNNYKLFRIYDKFIIMETEKDKSIYIKGSDKDQLRRFNGIKLIWCSFNIHNPAINTAQVLNGDIISVDDILGVTSESGQSFLINYAGVKKVISTNKGYHPPKFALNKAVNTEGIYELYRKEINRRNLGYELLYTFDKDLNRIIPGRWS